MLNEFDNFIDSDMDIMEEIVEFQRQLFRRYRDLEGQKGGRSAGKRQQIEETTLAVIRMTKENDRLLETLEGQVFTLEAQAEGIQGTVPQVYLI